MEGTPLLRLFLPRPGFTRYLVQRSLNMRLFILRHGKARRGSPDELRELKKRGRDDLRTVLTKRLDALESVVQIQSSALVRAVQTASLAARLIGFDGDIVENMHLAPWGGPLEFVESIEESAGDLLIASHQPFVSNLVTLLTGQGIWMPTSSLVCIEAEYMVPGLGSVLWQENPRFR